MGLVNPKNLVKPTQKPKKWVGPGNWVCMVSKTGKPIIINGFQVKPDPDPKNSLTQ